ncbi:helix-turn-helix domain-containing protein [Crossiella sp. SN42]|uniref:helix-turn-helix domain-containing protein n=1 Tax=Crossiella sp. SN42 TaxID=2944808 RepID=UPI00207D6BE7|nr:helix-turn-helix transcriptional regulator [Crossiella sp. SN42]MCO1579159.1 helix-turn-helix domain-containing protein [Crossiella sp. SN42]
MTPPETTNRPASFGELITTARTTKKLTQRALAEQLDISHTTVARIENGTTPTPTPEVLIGLIEVLEVDVRTAFELLPPYRRLLDALEANEKG